MPAVTPRAVAGPLAAIVAGCLLCGCQQEKPFLRPHRPLVQAPKEGEEAIETGPSRSHVRPVSYQANHSSAETPSTELVPLPTTLPPERLVDLELTAEANNPSLRRMRYEASAEWARTAYADKLPDPSISAMFFGDAMNFVPDRQLAELQLMQMIPWLDRLEAEARRAQLEALAAQNMAAAERLRIIGDLRAAWYKLYVLGEQVEYLETEKEQLELLLQSLSARVTTGNAGPADVLAVTLELSRLQEQIFDTIQQQRGTSAEINRLVGRDIHTPVVIPSNIDIEFPDWSHPLLQQIARRAQPELIAARLRTAAARSGIEVNYLKRRPDVTVGAGWMVMSADPADPMPGAGNDAWTLNVGTTIPLWRQKYDAMVIEATRKHHAARASEDETLLRIDGMLRDLWESALAQRRTLVLYQETILPQARQIVAASQQSLANNAVPFERVVQDIRALLKAQLDYQRTVGQYASTLARIRQAVGVDLLPIPQDHPQPE